MYLKIIFIVILAVIGLWVSSSFLPQVREAVQPQPTIVEGIVPPTPHAPIVRKKHYVQLASFKTKSAASKHVVAIGDRYGALEIRKATLPNGVWFRVVAPKTSIEEAKHTCEEIKANGLDCIVLSFNG